MTDGAHDHPSIDRRVTDLEVVAVTQAESITDLRRRVAELENGEPPPPPPPPPPSGDWWNVRVAEAEKLRGLPRGPRVADPVAHTQRVDLDGVLEDVIVRDVDGIGVRAVPGAQRFAWSIVDGCGSVDLARPKETRRTAVNLGPSDNPDIGAVEVERVIIRNSVWSGLAGPRGHGHTMIDCELTNNTTSGASFTTKPGEACASKLWSSRNSGWDRPWVHDETAGGLWFDGQHHDGGRDGWVHGGLIERCADWGIFCEQSPGPFDIIDTVIRDCEKAIRVVGSDATITGCVLQCGQGVWAGVDQRNNPLRVNAQHNYVDLSTWDGGGHAWGWFHAGHESVPVTWQSNHNIFVLPSLDAELFRAAGQALTWDQWRSRGFDADSEVLI